MKKKELALSGLTASYDERTGRIELKVKDKRIEGKPFKVSLSHSSDTYRTILALLEANDLANPDGIGLPKGVHLESPSDLIVPGLDPRTNFNVGLGVGNTPVKVNLNSSPNLLISGLPGSGKSVALRNVLIHGLSNNSIQLRVIEPKTSELSGYAYREQDTYASSFIEVLTVLTKTINEMHNRYVYLEKIGQNTYLDIDLPAIYVVLDGIEDYLFPVKYEIPGSIDAELENWKLLLRLLQKLMNFGRAAGVHVIMSSTRIPDETTLRHFDTRMYLGNNSDGHADDLFQKRVEFGGSLLRERGRGILQTNREQKLFQMFYAHYDTYRAKS